MTHVAPHDVPSLYNRQLLPQPSYVGLQRETLRINQVNGLVKTGIENPSTRPNHLDLGDKIVKHKLKEKNRECDCCGGRCSTCCPHKNTPPTREPYYPSEGNMQNVMVMQIRFKMDCQYVLLWFNMNK